MPYSKLPDGKTLIFMQHGRSAGNALCAMMQEELGDDVFFKLGVTGETTRTHSDFLAAAKANTHRFYGGHFCYGIHRHIEGPVDYITTIREPVERALSNFEAWGSGRGYTLEQWLDHDYDSNNGMVKRHIGIGQVDALPYDFCRDQHRDQDISIGQAQLEQAFSNIEQDFSLILLHSHLTESTVLLRRLYDLRPLFSLQRQFYNHLPNPVRVENYPAKLIEKVVEKNKYDLILFDRLHKQFMTKINDQPDDFHDETRVMRDVGTILSQRGTQNLEEQQILQRLNAGLNQLIQAGRHADAVQILRCFTIKEYMDQAFGRKALDVISQIGTRDDLTAEVAAYQDRFGVDPAIQAMVA